MCHSLSAWIRNAQAKLQGKDIGFTIARYVDKLSHCTLSKFYENIIHFNLLWKKYTSGSAESLFISFSLCVSFSLVSTPSSPRLASCTVYYLVLFRFVFHSAGSWIVRISFKCKSVEMHAFRSSASRNDLKLQCASVYQSSAKQFVMRLIANCDSWAFRWFCLLSLATFFFSFQMHIIILVSIISTSCCPACDSFGAFPPLLSQLEAEAMNDTALMK